MNQQSKMASFHIPKMTKETLSIESFPSEMQGRLSEAFDKDGDGVIDSQELMEAANLYIQTKITNGLLRKGICFTAALSFALVACIAGLTYGIVDASKDTRVDGRALMTKQEEPVSVSNNELKLSLAALPFVPYDVTSKVTDITFESEEGDKVFFRKTLSVDLIPETSLQIETTAGDLITWDIDNSGEIIVTMKDGTSWAKDEVCTECTAVNVFSSPAVIEGIKNFEESTSANRRHLLLSNSAHRVLDGTDSNSTVSVRSYSKCSRILYSDERLKEDITFIGKSPSGIPTYTFKYRQGMDTIDDDIDAMGTYFGVMAQDLLEIAPEALIEHPLDGYYRVDYSKIDVDFIKLM